MLKSIMQILFNSKQKKREKQERQGGGERESKIKQNKQKVVWFR